MGSVKKNGVIKCGHELNSGAPISTVTESAIREVWASNLEEEFRHVRAVIKKYPYVAMDTEFPGVVARPIGEFASKADYQYQLLRCNVDLLKLIQVGLTFMNDDGQLPPDCATWQFNFKFSLGEDMYAVDSIDLLRACGINFDKQKDDGIDVLAFAELLMTSGLVLCPRVTWLSFHSGYDFGYLIKILTNKELPEDESSFFELLKLFFPSIYDVKILMRHRCVKGELKGGLQELAGNLDVKRVGPQHQAGSDSLLTGMTFFQIKKRYYSKENMSSLEGYLFGLGATLLGIAAEANTASSGTLGQDSSALPYDKSGESGDSGSDPKVRQTVSASPASTESVESTENKRDTPSDQGNSNASSSQSE